MATFTLDARLEDAISQYLAAAAPITTTIGADVAIGFDAQSVTTIGAFGLVVVHCSGHSPGVLGMHKLQIADPAYVTIGCFTRTGQDLDGTNLQELAAAVEDEMADSAVVSTLNGLVTGLHIYANGLHLGDRSREDGDGYRQATLSLEIKATITS